MTDAQTAGLLDADALTPAEQAYIESGGEKIEGLTAESTGGAPEAAAATSADPAKAEPAKADTSAATKDAAATTTQAQPNGQGIDHEYAADDALADAVAHDPKREPPKRVSFHKFRRTEERAKTAERELAELREKFARGDERMRLLTEALTVAPPTAEGKTQEDDPAPDPEKDIFAFVRWQSRQMDKLHSELKNTRGEIGQTRETIQQREEGDALRETYQRDAVTFAQKTPDFVQAYNHMLTARAEMLADQGYAEADIRSILATEERGLVQRAIQAGKSPAEMIYGMARRFGYQTPTPAAAAAAPAAGATKSDAAAGATAGAAPAAAAKPSVTEEIARIQRGQEAGKTLSGAGTGAVDLTPEALALMPDHEFEALLAKKPDQVLALMGRLN